VLAHTTTLRRVRALRAGLKTWKPICLAKWAISGGWTLAYLKVRGQWVYLYRAVDKAGRTVDFLL